jgi:hypothetical protein|tara:strand:+ start:281 stop:565 length:285 start_codon:yes stop_codon:yes gene_type:complete
MIEVKKVSMLTRKVNTMVLDTTQEKLDLYFGTKNRPLIQDLFPELSTDEREFLQTGATPEEWAEQTEKSEAVFEEYDPLKWLDKYILSKSDETQ